MKKIKFIIIAFFIFSLFSNAAIYNNKKEVNSNSTKINYAQNKKVLKIALWGGKTRYEKMLQVVKLFQKKYKDIRIEFIFDGYEDYWKNLDSKIKNNQCYDVFAMTFWRFPYYVNNGVMQDINEISSIDLSSFYKSAINVIKINDKLYGIPISVVARGLFYDPDILNKAGIPEINKNLTWNELEEISNEIHKKLNISGIDCLDFYDFEMYIKVKNQFLYSKDYKTAGFKEETLIEFFNMILRMKKSGAMDIFRTSRGNESSFGNDKSAMKFTQSSFFNGFSKYKKGPVDITIPPGPNNQKSVFLNPVIIFCISSTSDNKNEAGMFIDFLANDIEANINLNLDFGIPTSKVARDYLIKSRNQEEKKVFEYLDFVADYCDLFENLNYPEAHYECKNYWDEIQKNVLDELIKPEDGAKKIISEWNKLLNR